MLNKVKKLFLMFLIGVYYIFKIKYGVRILVLNINLYYMFDKVIIYMDDFVDQFVWMEGILMQVRRDYEKVCEGLVCIVLFFIMLEKK